MKIQLGFLTALAVCATTLGAPAQAQVNNHYHPAVVASNACPNLNGTGAWVTVNGHHALALTDVVVGDPQEGYYGSAGFTVLGNVQAIAHGTFPSFANRGPLETGELTFQVYSHSSLAGTPGEEFYYFFSSNNGQYYVPGGGLFAPDVNVVNGVAHIPIINPTPGSGDGTQAAALYVILDNNNNAGPNRAIVGGWQLNGVPLDGTVLVDFSQCYSES